MTFEEFEKKYEDFWTYPYISGSGRSYKTDQTKPRLETSWTVGGMTGGSCWGTEADQSVSADDEPEMHDLDKILEETAPALTFLQYKSICRLLKTVDSTESEYYGNYYDKRTKWIDARELFEALVKMGYVQESGS